MEPLQFDDNQFRKLIEAFQPKPISKVKIADILALIQVVAIVCGGVWVVFEYLAFREHHEKLTLRQQELDLQMARITLDLKGGERELQQLEISQSTTPSVKYTARTVTVRHLTTHTGQELFEASLDVGIENASDSPFEVSYSIVHYFLGKLRQSTQPEEFAVIQHPPGLFGESRVGALEWRPVGCHASQYFATKHDVAKIFEKANCPSVDKGGGLTAMLRPGERSAFQQTYLVRAGSNEYLALAVYFGLDGVTEPGQGKIMYFREVKPLMEEPSREQPLE